MLIETPQSVSPDRLCLGQKVMRSPLGTLEMGANQIRIVRRATMAEFCHKVSPFAKLIVGLDRPQFNGTTFDCGP